MSALAGHYSLQRRRDRNRILLMLLILPLLFLADLMLGTVSVPVSDVLQLLLGGEAQKPSWEFIILDTRLPQSITAVFAGAGLAVGGLLLQTYFRNPLAGPDVLGVSSGAMLGVAVVFMGLDSFGFALSGMGGNIMLILSAFCGAILVLMIVLSFSRISRDPVTVIIAGLMIAYLVGAMVNLLQNTAAREGLQQFVFWGFGTFSGLDLPQSMFFSITVVVVLSLSVFLIKSLNGWVLGESYARTMGVNVSRFRWRLIVISGLLTALITAFCGPIAFIGIAVPHLVRRIIKSEDHGILLPSVALFGSLLSLLCSILTRLPFFESPVPLNAVTSIIGAPVVIWVIIRNNKSKGGTR